MNKIIEIAKDFLDEQFKKEYEKKIDKKDKVEYVIKTKAWGDMTQHERFNKESKIVPKKNDICDYLSEKIPEISRLGYKKWHKEVISELKKYNLSYGLAQKLINMSVKYLYFMEIVYEDSLFDDVSFKEYENDFDIPLDSYIMKWFFYNSLNDEQFYIDIKDKINCWTKLEDEYDHIQNGVKDLLKSTYPELPCVCAETLVWQSIKNHKKKYSWDV